MLQLCVNKTMTLRSRQVGPGVMFNKCHYGTRDAFEVLSIFADNIIYSFIIEWPSGKSIRYIQRRKLNISRYTLFLNLKFYNKYDVQGAFIWIQPEKRPKWDSSWQFMVPLSIVLLTTIGPTLIGSHGGLQVDKPKVGKVTGSVDSPWRAITQKPN